jgi:hypothetical protein
MPTSSTTPGLAIVLAVLGVYAYGATESEARGPRRPGTVPYPTTSNPRSRWDPYR